jgi:hypothetical protein
VGEESFFDEEDNFHTNGVIKNNGTILVESIVPVVTFYDSNDRVVDAWFDLPYPSRLDPNQTTTFDIKLDKSRLDAIGEIDHYLLQVDYYLERNSSKIIFSISSEGEDENATVSVYREGEQIEVSGYITPEAGQVLVTLILTKPDNTTTIVQVITTPEGYFNYTFIPEDPGAWSITANWPGSVDVEGATSVPTSFTVARARRTPSLLIAAIATTIGVVIPVGLAAVTGQFFNALISRLPDSLIEYLQTIYDNMRVLPRLQTGEKLTKLIQGDMFIAGFSMLISTIVFGYVAANGLPDFLHMSVLSVIIPMALIAATIDRIAGELTEFSILKMFKLQGELELWLYGIIAFLVSGFIFRIPFSTPVRFTYEDERFVEKTRVFIKILDRVLALPLLIPFSIMIMLGFRILGDLGILMCLTKIFYSLVPVKPMVGKDIFDYSRRVWISIFAPMMILYFTWILNVLPWTVFFTTGLISTLVGISLIIISRQSKTWIMLKPNSIIVEHGN